MLDSFDAIHAAAVLTMRADNEEKEQRDAIFSESGYHALGITVSSWLLLKGSVASRGEGGSQRPAQHFYEKIYRVK